MTISNYQGYRMWAIIATLLLLITGFTGFRFWQQVNTLSGDFVNKEELIAALEQEKAQLAAQIDTLNLVYTTVKSENGSLQGKVAKFEHLVAEKANALERLRKKDNKNAKDLREQVAGMQKAKTELETVVALLQSENEQLRLENQRLNGENEQLRGDKQSLSTQVSNLSEKLEDQIRKTQSARFKATAFRVEVEKKGDKLTTRAKKVQEVAVSFDLADVPASFQGPQKLYLVIADDKGRPVTSANPVKTVIEAPSGPVEIIAQQVKTINISSLQRLSFVYKLNDRLQKGSYIAAIYSEKGLLGVSSFRLN